MGEAQGSLGQMGGFPKQECNVPLTTGMGAGSVFSGVQQQHGCSGYGSLSYVGTARSAQTFVEE